MYSYKEFSDSQKEKFTKAILLRFTCLFIFLFLLLTGFSVYGQNTWTGGNSSNWHDAGNWTGGIPNASDDVEIPAGSTVIVDGADEEIATISTGDENIKYTTLQERELYFYNKTRWVWDKKL